MPIGVTYTSAAKQKCWSAIRQYLVVLLLCFLIKTSIAQGNYSFSGSETVNFGTIDLSTVNNGAWGTERATAPGYFSAVNGAAYTGGSDLYNVNGYIKKYGDQVFTFPVGSGSDLRTLTISAPSSATDAYATAWIVGDPSNSNDLTLPNAGAHSILSHTAPIIAVSNAGQWDWQVGDAGNLGTGSTGSGSGLTITVSIPNMTTFASTASLRLVGWNGTSWIDLSGTSTASGNTENSTLRGIMIAGITAIGIGSTSFALPLNLISFTATAEDCNARIRWETSEEQNTDKFIVEQSGNGISFTAIATELAGNMPGENQYNIIVPQPQGIYYYRLKMIDSDGKYTYSKVVSCKTICTASGSIVVYPNPVIDQSVINVSITTAYRGKVVLLISNEIGQKMKDVQQYIAFEKTSVPISVSGFAQGVYYISVFTNEGVKLGVVQKFIKAN